MAARRRSTSSRRRMAAPSCASPFRSTAAGRSMPEPRARIRALVVDDEPSARDAVLTLLGEHDGIDVVGEATNGVEAVDAIRRLRPELLFLDIQMPDLDGFSVLEQLGADVPAGVVFVTAHDEHAIRAFDVHAL